MKDRRLEWSPHVPHPRQLIFLDYNGKEALYGGSAGGGKSDALLMAALQYVDHPKYSAILFRRSFKDLALPGALMDRAREWIGDRAKWKGDEFRYTFPSGATLQFGYLEQDKHKYRYQSAEFQYIGFDELTQFEETPYRYLFSRLRQTADMDIPLRVRAASNPGGIGHDWVKDRFLLSSDRPFFPANLKDNPSVNYDEYVESLDELDPITREQLLDGNWDVGDDSILDYDWIKRAEREECEWAGQPEKRTELYLGVDVGRSRDHSVVWTWEKVGDVVWAREILVLSKTPFHEQMDAIRDRMTSSVVKCQIDRGFNPQLAEDLERFYPGRCVGMQLTTGRQGQLAAQLANGFNEQRVRIPKEKTDLRADLRLVKRGGISSGNVQVITTRDATGHADRFWAAALGYDAAIHRPPPRRTRGPVVVGGRR